MRYTVYDVLIGVKGKIHGGSLPTDTQAALDEGRRNLLGKIHPPEMERKAYIENAIYDQVEKYACPEDLTFEDVVDIKELPSYRNLDTIGQPLAQVYRRQFDNKNRDNIYQVGYENGVKSMQIFRPRGLHKYQHLILNEVNSLTNNGTWNIGGNVVNLRLDQLNHVTKKASLSFDINDSSTSGFIENFTMKPVNIEDYMNMGAAFSWLSLPIPQNMTSVRLTLGSNQSDLTTDYFYGTVNQPHDNNQFTTGWNLLKYMLNDVMSVGNPNPKAIGYMRLDFTTTGTGIPGCNMDSLIVRKGHVYETVYNSAWCFIDAETQAWKKYTTKNSDQLPFEEATFQLYMLEVALVVQKNIFGNGGGAQSDVTGIEDELAGTFYRGRLVKEGAYARYQKQHKSEFIEPEQYTNRMGRQKYGFAEYTGRHRHRDSDWFEHGGEDCDSSGNSGQSGDF